MAFQLGLIAIGFMLALYLFVGTDWYEQSQMSVREDIMRALNSFEKIVQVYIENNLVFRASSAIWNMKINFTFGMMTNILMLLRIGVGSVFQ